MIPATTDRTIAYVCSTDPAVASMTTEERMGYIRTGDPALLRTTGQPVVFRIAPLSRMDLDLAFSRARATFDEDGTFREHPRLKYWLASLAIQRIDHLPEGVEVPTWTTQDGPRQLSLDWIGDQEPEDVAEIAAAVWRISVADQQAKKKSRRWYDRG